jgi:hypothetical protein
MATFEAAAALVVEQLVAERLVAERLVAEHRCMV